MTNKTANNVSNSPKISVVMPAYNHEKFLNETIESVLNQTFSDFELIIIDDGSKDNSGKICQSYDDSRVHYHYQENQDAFNAINNGLKIARGEYLTIINSDDVFHPNRLQRIMEEVERHDLLCVFTEVELIDDDSNIIDDASHFWRQWHNRNRDYFTRYGDLYTTFLNGNIMVTTSNLLFHRKIYESIGGFSNYRYLHDYDYIFRILEKFEKQTRYLADERLLQYRLHGGNTISQAAIVGREQDREIIRRALMAKFSKEEHKYLDVGIDRLIALEHELVQARHELAQAQMQAQAAELAAPKTRWDFYKIHVKNALKRLSK